MQEALHREGYVQWPGRLDAAGLIALANLSEQMDPTQPGHRLDPRLLHDADWLRPIEADVRPLLGGKARPVRALLFDKRGEVNWVLGWHQDRTIEVAEETAVPGFGPFTRKQGRLHVAPPIAIVEAMLTVRLHLDPVDRDNGVLVVAPGSHREGFIAEDRIETVIARCGEAECPAGAGEVWIYATPILHRSARSASAARRRVLQIDYAHLPLPGGLRWLADS
ncbi:hypothetical protein GCM10011380_21550 [Sphingomonas metalli]|uniref:Phytanoyl-CoA dioxygenase n=1 Tax=Sphingomonas metalli TaxID=1779358 RepID=A0A916WUU3_9SPHN|nr:phytanoyl-CoA dioxygenase family protein [Sphingomonas metalli]GGB31850.1 hypothetical protein GCM10011380_21550 [Sphingomonas metalli]